MAKPSKQQLEQLDNLRVIVVEIMNDMAVWENFDLDLLYQIPLAVLKRNATQRHGACLLYTSPSPRDLSTSRMPSSA